MEETDFPEGVREILLQSEPVVFTMDEEVLLENEALRDKYCADESLWETVPIRSGYEYKGIEYDLNYYHDTENGKWFFFLPTTTLVYEDPAA